jgi:hypothetical protein
MARARGGDVSVPTNWPVFAGLFCNSPASPKVIMPHRATGADAVKTEQR